MRLGLIATLILVLTAKAPAVEPLTIGNEAPKFGAPPFLLGEPVKELKRGTIYVVEFSGTECLPCTKCIPHLTELQKKHKEIVIISIYSEGKKEVAEFLAKHRDTIGFRVAIDPERKLQTAWSAAAERAGVPDAFIVDVNGKIAWIGHPDEMAKPLSRIVAGTYDSRADAIRLRLAQSVARAERIAAERENKARTESDRINAMIIDGKRVEALSATEAAIKEYRDTTQGLGYFLGTKVYLLTRMPGKQDAAAEFALEAAVAARLSGNQYRCGQLANSLLNAASQPDPKDRDVRLLELAVDLLNESENELAKRVKYQPDPDQFLLMERFSVHYTLGRANHMRGDREAALRHVEQAIELLKAAKPTRTEDPTAFEERQARWFADLEAARKDYRR